MRVLGIDPGSQITGFGVIDVDGPEFIHVHSGTIHLSAAPLSDRLGRIHNELSEIIADTQPLVMAVEKVFMARNAQSALVLGQARGAAIVAGVGAGLEIAEYTALQIKQAVVGRGNAAKQQVQHMVRALVGLQEPITSDRADALACAICHANTARGRQRLLAGVVQ